MGTFMHRWRTFDHRRCKKVNVSKKEGFLVELSEEAVSKIKKSRDYVDNLLVGNETIVYGINKQVLANLSRYFYF